MVRVFIAETLGEEDEAASSRVNLAAVKKALGLNGDDPDAMAAGQGDVGSLPSPGVILRNTKCIYSAIKHTKSRKPSQVIVVHTLLILDFPCYD
jgi:hypothetical protein